MEKKVHTSKLELKELQSILALHPGAYVYGSRVKGLHKKFSDIDICFIREEPISDFEIEVIKDKCEQSNLPFQVDICNFLQLDSNFQKIIEADKMPFPYAKIPLIDDGSIKNINWLFMRHAEPDITIKSDFHQVLSAKGIEQANSFKASNDLQLYNCVISSPAHRSLATTEILKPNTKIFKAPSLYLPLHVDDRDNVIGLLNKHKSLQSILANDKYGSWARYVKSALYEICYIVHGEKDITNVIVVAHNKIINNLGFIIAPSERDNLINKDLSYCGCFKLAKR